MKIYKVAVTEIRRKAVSVRAENKEDAEQRALDAWKNTEIILDDFDDFEGIEADVLDDGSDDDGSLPYDSVIGGYPNKVAEDE